MDREYPFTRRTDGHPKLALLIERLLREHESGAEPAAGNALALFLWDTDHSSPLIKEALGSEQLVRALTKRNAMLVKEGPSSLNEVLARFVDGKADELATRAKNDPAYHAANPELHRRLSDSWHRFFVAAKQTQLDVFHPEPDRLTSQQDGDNAETKPFLRAAGRANPARRLVSALVEAGGRACTAVLVGALGDSEPELVSRAMKEHTEFTADRRGADLNTSVAKAIQARRGGRPVLVHYGAGHGALEGEIAKDGPTIGITIITSRRTPLVLVPEQRLGKFVYFAAEDEVVSVPMDARERAAFIERLVLPEHPHDPRAQSREERLHCFDRVLALKDPLWLIGREARALNARIGPSDTEAGEMLLRRLRREYEKSHFQGLPLDGGYPAFYQRPMPTGPEVKGRGRGG